MFWSGLFHVSFVSLGPNFSAYKIGDWASQCLSVIAGFVGFVLWIFGSKHRNHGQGPWEEVVPVGLGRAIRSKPGPGPQCDGC